MSDMPTDDERRETAAKLRRLAKQHDGVVSDLVGKHLGLVPDKRFPARSVYTSDSVSQLADLIAPQTCFDTESKDSKSFTCSACGFSESKLVVSPFTSSFLWVKPSYCYCPGCGAKVAENGDE